MCAQAEFERVSGAVAVQGHPVQFGLQYGTEVPAAQARLRQQSWGWTRDRRHSGGCRCLHSLLRFDGLSQIIPLPVYHRNLEDHFGEPLNVINVMAQLRFVRVAVCD